MDYWTTLITYFFIGTVKFVVAAGLMSADIRFDFITSLIVLIGGGSLGTIVFYYFGSWINKMFDKLFKRKKKKEKKTFTKKNRMVIKIKKKYGLYGLALLTPVVLSIPVGCILASRFYGKDRRTVPFLLASVVLWSVAFPLYKLFIGS